MRRQVGGSLVLVLLVGAGVLLGLVLSRSSATAVTLLDSFSESGVQVDLALEQSGGGLCSLSARYTPLLERFHVYSKDLPPNGVNGLGRPTRLDIVTGLAAAGELSASEATIDLRIETLDEVFPVYPDGPVTLRLPVWVTGDGNAQIQIVYMTCSTSSCLAPMSKTLNIHLAQCARRPPNG